MPAWLIIVLIAVALLVGLGRLVLRLNGLAARVEFGTEYLEKFSQLAKSLDDNTFDRETYVWLTQYVPKMESEMGYHGMLQFYRPPYANFAIRNYMLVSQTLSDMRARQAPAQVVGVCQDAMLRYLGELRDIHDSLRGQLKNPFVWLREAFSLLITLPLRLAQWFGLYEYGTFAKLSTSWPMKALTFISTLVGLAVAVMTLVLGWPKFVVVVTSWFHR